jgi:hypothetical protein
MGSTVIKLKINKPAKIKEEEASHLYLFLD